MAKRAAAAKDVAPSPAPAPAPTGPAYIPLDQIIGHAAAIAVLQSAMASGRLHHSWIFHGPPGVGKFTTALSFAGAAIDPTTAPDLSGKLAPDPDSPCQRMLRAGTHPDVHIITRELAKVSREDNVRKSKQTVIAKEVIEEFLVEPALRTRAVAGESIAAKFFIVDEAELLQDRTQNSLLKILEEPPVGSIFVLVTSQEDRLLPTIRSRSNRVGFFPLPDAEMKTWLKRSGVADELPAEERAWVIDYAAGSPGAAQSAVESGLYEWRTTLEPLLARLDRGEFVPEFAAAAADLVEARAKAVQDANKDASKEAANKLWGRRMLAFLAERYRRSLHSSRGGGPPERAVAAIDAIQDAEGRVAANVQIKFALEDLAAQIAREPAPL